jgi:hypothetical protein
MGEVVVGDRQVIEARTLLERERTLAVSFDLFGPKVSDGGVSRERLEVSLDEAGLAADGN